MAAKRLMSACLEDRFKVMLRACLFSFDIFQTDTLSYAQTVAGLLDPP